MTPASTPCTQRTHAAPRPELRSGFCPEFAHELVRALPRLRRYVVSQYGAAHADDIVQDTLLRALEHASTFDPQRALWPWLRAIAANARTRRVERESRTVGATCELEDLFDATALGADSNPNSNPASSIDATDEVRAMLARLRGPERSVIDRHYLQGMSVAEIATQRGVPRGTVKAQLSRGRRRLALLVASLATVLGSLLIGGSGAHSLAVRPAPRLLESSLVIEHARASRPRFARIDYTAVHAPRSRPKWNVAGARVVAAPAPAPHR